VIQIVEAYLAAGLALTFVGPAAKGLRLELAELKDRPEATPLTRAAFACAVALTIILFWPFMVPSAWRSLKPPTALEAAAHLAAMALDGSGKACKPTPERNPKRLVKHGDDLVTFNDFWTEMIDAYWEKVSAEESDHWSRRNYWAHLKRMMQPGDELYRFSSPPEAWEHLAGRAGVAIVRNGEVIHQRTNLMN
jgi:hypothetical protein